MTGARDGEVFIETIRFHRRATSTGSSRGRRVDLRSLCSIEISTLPRCDRQVPSPPRPHEAGVENPLGS
jgi:hypothetical protein